MTKKEPLVVVNDNQVVSQIDAIARHSILGLLDRVNELSVLQEQQVLERVDTRCVDRAILTLYGCVQNIAETMRDTIEEIESQRN